MVDWGTASLKDTNRNVVTTAVKRYERLSDADDTGRELQRQRSYRLKQDCQRDSRPVVTLCAGLRTGVQRATVLHRWERWDAG